ncbi:MAG: hypothetical protein APF84_11145 [Gracilibacter sp. BRH_c7a]|nr:MAG: hypothetical protein APF84_11145 [Gracilibacter sp. BRH_c7a]
MIRKSKPVYVLILLLVLSLTLLGGCAKTQPAQSPTEQPVEKPYFEDKILTIIVPNSPGGGHDTAARTLAPYIQEYAGAKDVRVVNKKGGGGILGMNEVWHTKGDGETIMFASAITHVMAYIAEDPAIEFNPTESTWLARAINKPLVLTVGEKSSIDTADDLMNLDRPYIYPAVGVDDDFYTMNVIADSLGIELNIVTGFDGEPECQVAQVQGTVDGLFTTFEKARSLVKSGDLVPIMVLNPEPVSGIADYPDGLPTVLDVVGDGPGRQAMEDIVELYALYESFWGPPNMDPEAAAAWRDIMDKVFNNTEAMDKIVKLGGTPAYIPGAELEKMIPDLMKSATGFKAIFDEATAKIK